MKPVLLNRRIVAGRGRLGFSLLEMLVGIGILSVLVLALYALFDQTQKALRANINQVDASEGGRSVMELLVRDVLRARATRIGTNYVFDPGTTNVTAVNLPATNLEIRRTNGGLNDPQWQAIFGDNWRRDTTLHELFYLVPLQRDQWVGAGLFVGAEDPAVGFDGLGTLYRYEDNRPLGLRGAGAVIQARELKDRFFQNLVNRTNLASRLIDGVVFFRVTPFGALGEPLDHTLLGRTNYFPIPTDVIIGPNTIVNPPVPGAATVFRNRALPTAIELELGILPPQLAEQYRALSSTVTGLRYRFLTNNAASVLVFRQRIPLPTAPALLP